MKSFVLMMTLLWCTASYGQTVLIKNGTIVSGDPQAQGRQADVLIEGKRIVGVAPDIATPAGARLIDASGKFIAPGFFNAETQIGLNEVGAVDSTGDSHTTDELITASLRVADAINENSTIIPHNRTLGLTHALVQPESKSNIFAGSAAIVQLSQDDMVLDQAAAMVVTLGAEGSELAGGSRAAAMAQLREALEDARDFRTNRDSYNRGSRREYGWSRHDLEALGSVVSGKVPLLVHVDRASDIKQILKLARQQSVKLILSGVSEGWIVARQIASQDVPVILDPIYNLPSSYEKIGSRLDNAKLMNDAGVKLMFTGMGWQNTHNAFLVRQSAGNAVANGLPYAVAIQALSSNPAEVFGIRGYGAVREGKDANLVIWSGDPLELLSEVETVMIQGVDYPLQSRATRLRDRYWNQYNSAN